jgi:hypothetical protein
VGKRRVWKEEEEGVRVVEMFVVVEGGIGGR